MPGRAACARRSVTSPRRGRSASGEPSGLTGGARMTRCTGTRRTEPWCGSTGSVAAGADTPSAVPTNWGRIRARLRRASRAVVCRTAKRRTCAAAGGRRGSRGRQGAGSAPGGRKRQRPSPEWAETACGLRWPRANRARARRAAPSTGCRRIRLASSSRPGKHRRASRSAPAEPAPGRGLGTLAAKAGSGRAARMPEETAPDPRDAAVRERPARSLDAAPAGDHAIPGSGLRLGALAQIVSPLLHHRPALV